VPPPESSRVSRSDVEIPEFDLQSLLIPQEAIDKYKMCHARLKKELKLISLEDHIWTLKSFDNNNVGVVKLQCGECQKDFGGGSGDHSKSTIHNLFANFKKSHIMSNAHICNWCRRKGIPWTEHPQSSVQKGKTLILTAEDHKRAVEDGLAILDMVISVQKGGHLLQLETLKVTVSSPYGTKFVVKYVAISSSSVPPRRTWWLI
jgi:hypothetical protein